MKIGKIKLFVASMMLLLVGLAQLGAVSAKAAPAENQKRSYAVVVSEKTYAEPAWKEVADTLVKKHNGFLVTHAGDLAGIKNELSAKMPDYICFVGKPIEMGRDTVIYLHRMLRTLDKDPYTDAMWGIVTGYEAVDALRIAKETKPLIIKAVAGSNGPGLINGFKQGFASDERNAKNFWVRKDNKTTHIKCNPDPTEELVKGFNTIPVDYFETSGHATTNDWQIIYNQHKGQFRCKNGNLYGLNSKKQVFPIKSLNPKIYLPMGNCLIGRIPVSQNGKEVQRNCMALAWMRSGGVRQFCGYTVVTWFGYAGWGTRGMLHENGHYSFAEAFYFNNQALMHQILTRFPKLQYLNCPAYEHRYFRQILGYMQKKYRLTQKDELGLLWDRDVQVFYGDPKWVAKFEPKEKAYTMKVVDLGNNKFQMVVETKKDGNWPGRPLFRLLPKRLQDIKITNNAGHKPVVTDNFIMLPLSGKYKKGEKIVVEFEGKDLQIDKNYDSKAAKAIKTLEKLPAEYRKDCAVALKSAGKNLPELVKTIKDCPADQVEGLAFLLANMPVRDINSLKADYLLENINLAYKAYNAAPWKAQVSKEQFLNYVLPYANLNEKRDGWRAIFVKRFLKKAHEFKTAGEAAVWLNNNAFKEIGVSYHATKRPKPDQSVTESIKAKYASCTGLSIILADLCRAAGIPARVTGILSWKKKITDRSGNHGGNHNWVEIWDGSKWQHLGASEKSALSKTWFTGKTGYATSNDKRRWNNRIFAAKFGRKNSDQFFPMVWNLKLKYVPAIDVTDSYRKAAEEAKKAKEAAKK